VQEQDHGRFLRSCLPIEHLDASHRGRFVCHPISLGMALQGHCRGPYQEDKCVNQRQEATPQAHAGRLSLVARAARISSRA
jgi:hypothetical protein